MFHSQWLIFIKQLLIITKANKVYSLPDMKHEVFWASVYICVFRKQLLDIIFPFAFSLGWKM